MSISIGVLKWGSCFLVFHSYRYSGLELPDFSKKILMLYNNLAQLYSTYQRKRFLSILFCIAKWIWKHRLFLTNAWIQSWLRHSALKIIPMTKRLAEINTFPKIVIIQAMAGKKSISCNQSMHCYLLQFSFITKANLPIVEKSLL